MRDNGRDDRDQHPGRGTLQLEHLVSDVTRHAGSRRRIDGWTRQPHRIHIATESRFICSLPTRRKASRHDQQLNLTATRLTGGNEQEQKRAYVNKLDQKK